MEQLRPFGLARKGVNLSLSMPIREKERCMTSVVKRHSQYEEGEEDGRVLQWREQN